jgi:quercetin dioxygenase-like cupin family protein
VARALGDYVEVAMKSLLLSISLVLLAGGTMAEDASHTNIIAPDAVKWTENPAFPKGIQIATLVGDPTKAGETVVQRIKFPPNFIMPPHTHPFLEVVTVISGNIGTNSGEKPDKKRLAAAGINVGVPVKARALCMDRRWRGRPAGPVHRPGRH